MKIISERKGITPVIAIVLLLMVTVGAVGVVYTQFQSLVGDPSDTINEQQRNQNTDISIIRGESSKSNLNTGSDHNDDNYGTLQLKIQNTGSVSRNTTSFLMISPSGHEIGGVSDKTECTDPTNSKIIDPGETIDCETGVLFPEATNEVEIRLQLKGASKDWSFTCRHSPTGNPICSQ